MGPSSDNKPKLHDRCGTHHGEYEDCPADFTKEEFEFRQEYKTWPRAKKRAYKRQWLKSQPKMAFCTDCKKKIPQNEYKLFAGKCSGCSLTIE